MSNLASEQLELNASDGGHISAYHVKPSGRVRGGLVVIQEIFGVNGHIRSVADRFAQEGYEVIAPALFDRVERGLELGYDDEGRKRGMAVRAQVDNDRALLDIEAAVKELGAGVGIVGYCWGGALAYLASARLDGLRAVVGYYGGGIAKNTAQKPRVPVLLHFGDRDKGIPLSDVEAIRAARPELEVQVYPAGHGFNCDVRESYDADSAKLALSRTLAFLARHLEGGRA